MSSIKDRINTSTNSVKSGKNLIKDVVNSYGGNVTSSVPTFQELADAIDMSLISSADPITKVYEFNEWDSYGYNFYECHNLNNKSGYYRHMYYENGDYYPDYGYSRNEHSNIYKFSLDGSAESYKCSAGESSYDASNNESTTIENDKYPVSSSNDSMFIVREGSYLNVLNYNGVVSYSFDMSKLSSGYNVYEVTRYPYLSNHYIVLVYRISGSTYSFKVHLVDMNTRTAVGELSLSGFSIDNTGLKYLRNIFSKSFYPIENSRYILTTSNRLNTEIFIYKYDESTRTITYVKVLDIKSYGYSYAIVGTKLIHLFSPGKHASMLLNYNTFIATEVSSSATSNVYDLLEDNISYSSDEINKVNYINSISVSKPHLYRIT